METQSPTPTTGAVMTTLANQPDSNFPSNGDSGSNIFSAKNDPDSGNKQSSGVVAFRYYFLLLGVVIVILAILLWLLHRRKKRQRAQLQQGGTRALARDLEGWQGAQALMHGTYRPHNAVPVHREEGLDENGEAPPPYQPKTEATVEDVAIPLRTLQRDPGERSQPPQYDEESQASPRPDTRPQP